MRSPQIDDVLIRRLYDRARAERWHLPIGVLAEALHASATRRFAGEDPGAHELEKYLESLHLEDLAVACACATGNDAAWEHFVREQRPLLYRAADVLDPSGGARELADSLYADLYGLKDRGGDRQSLFGYFHGRSSLTTWLRSVLAQRHIDRLRAQRRVESLPDDEAAVAPATSSGAADPDRLRYAALVERALQRAVSRLDARDRLRLACYYAQDLTLAEVGRLLREHEATVSRHLARTRQALRKDIERELRVGEGLGEAQVADCLASVVEDAGPIDLGRVLGTGEGGKESGRDRSMGRGEGRRGHQA